MDVNALAKLALPTFSHEFKVTLYPSQMDVALSCSGGKAVRLKALSFPENQLKIKGDKASFLSLDHMFSPKDNL